MAAITFFNQFYEDVMHGVHDFETDVITVGLTTNANAPVATNAVLANITQIAYTNLSARVVNISVSEGSDGTYEAVADDLVLTASGAVATFRWVFLYNDTPTTPLDPLIGFYDYGSDVTLANGETFTLNFGANWITLT